MFARVRLITRDEHEALVVPEQALVPQGDEQYVFRVVDGKASRVKVDDRPAPRRQGRGAARASPATTSSSPPASSSCATACAVDGARRRRASPAPRVAPAPGERRRGAAASRARPTSPSRAAAGAQVLTRSAAMQLPEICIKRPVFATVLSLIILLVGLISYTRLSVREYPRIDEPVVSVATTYRGASAEVVESQVTKPLEDSLAGIEGVEVMTSQSRSETQPDQRPLHAEARPRFGRGRRARQGGARARQAAGHDRRADHRQGRGRFAARSSTSPSRRDRCRRSKPPTTSSATSSRGCRCCPARPTCASSASGRCRCASTSTARGSPATS